MFYDARSRLNRLKRGIERAAARAGYTRRKGGITAMREELVDNKDQVEHRNARRHAGLPSLQRNVVRL